MLLLSIALVASPLLPSQSSAANFGSALAGGLDCDRDGRDELIIADATPVIDRPAWCGGVFDITTGDLRFRIGHGFVAEPSSASLRVISDRNGDGVDDVLVVASEHDGARGRGLLVASGTDGSKLSFMPLPKSSKRVMGGLSIVESTRSIGGETLTAVKDQASTGWIFSLDRETSWMLPAGYIPVGDLESRVVIDLIRRDARSGETLIDGLTLEPRWRLPVHGRIVSIQAVDDADGDSVRELLLLATITTPDDEVTGTLSLLSGASGEPVFCTRTTTCFETFVCEAQPVGDFNGDGVREIALSAWHMIGCEPVSILDGRTGKALHQIRQGLFASGPNTPNFLGTGFVAEEDVDGDGTLDVWIGTGYWKMGSRQDGVGLFSGDSGQLLRSVRRPK